MGIGRFVCVAVPFGLTLSSLVCILIVCLAGVTNKNLDMMDVTTKDLSISSSSLQNLLDLTKREDHFSALTIAALTGTGGAANITASDLGLADSYKVSLWNYCAETGSNKTCTKAKFNWAASALNTTAIDSLTSATGVNVTLPKEVRTALKTYAVVSKWTQVVYIMAFVATVAELLIGFFALCSRIGSCCTFIVSGVSTVAITIASIMATIQSSIVVGAIKSVAKAYGVKSSLNTSFLATTWLAVAFSLGAGLFWMFSICCCANSEHHKSNRGGRRSKNADQEKLIPTGSYQRVDNPAHPTAYTGQQQGIYNPQAQKSSRGHSAYEPYSHTAI